MLFHNLRLAFRFFFKNRLTSGINILGLAIGIACCLLALAVIRHETSYDRFHADYKNLFRIGSGLKTFTLSSTPIPLAPALNNEMGEIRESLRFTDFNVIVGKENEYFREKAVCSDANFLNVFNFPLKQGDARSALSDTRNVVLSEEMAKKYFGYADPLGQTLQIGISGKTNYYTVAGIAHKIPSNSSIRFDFLTRLENVFPEPGQLEREWMNYSVTTIVRTTAPQAIADVQNKIPAFVKKYMSETLAAEEIKPEEIGFSFQPLANYHLSGGDTANGMAASAGPLYLYIFGGIALLILLVACLNFMNLAAAQSSDRLLEIGVRKSMGAVRGQLTKQFLIEALLMGLAALGLAFLFTKLSLPGLQKILGFPINIRMLDDWQYPLAALGIALAAGLLAGIYPALLLSGLKARDAIQKRMKFAGGGWLAKSSIVFQFFLSIGLASGALLMYQQQRFMHHYDLGFKQENVLVVPMQTTHEEKGTGRRTAALLKQELAQHPQIISTTAVTHSFSRGNSARLIEKEDKSRALVFEYGVDYDYLNTLDMELLQGRNFSPSFSQDTLDGLIVNEVFVKAFGLKDPLQEPFKYAFGGIKQPRIVGVVKDFHFQGLQEKVEPAVLHMQPRQSIRFLLVKMAGGDPEETIALVKAAWQKTGVQKPFECFFLDEDLQLQYEKESRWGRAIAWATGLAVLIACLGLFGLTALSMVRRTKEIGIRKVLGASIPSMMALLSKDILKLVLIAFALSVPIAWWAMHKWLQNFAYRIEPDWKAFALAGFAAVALAFLTVGFQSIKAALANPVNSLRSE